MLPPPKLCVPRRQIIFDAPSLGLPTHRRFRMRFRSQTFSFFLSFASIAAAALATAQPSAAQQPSASITTGSPVAVTAADYQHAEKFLAYNTSPLVFHRVRPTWLPNDDRFWYRDASPDGIQFVLFDAARGTHQPAFDHAKLAAALSAAAGKPYEPAHLPFMTFDFSADQRSISFTLRGQNWKCDLQSYTCASNGKPAEPGTAPSPEVKSPDGKSAVF